MSVNGYKRTQTARGFSVPLIRSMCLCLYLMWKCRLIDGYDLLQAWTNFVTSRKYRFLGHEKYIPCMHTIPVVWHAIAYTMWALWRLNHFATSIMRWSESAQKCRILYKALIRIEFIRSLQMQNSMPSECSHCIWYCISHNALCTTWIACRGIKL